MPARLLSLAAAIAATLLVACGSSGTSTEINDMAESFFRALANDPPLAYTYLSQNCQDELPFLEFASGTVFIESILGENEPSVENVRVLRGDDSEIEAEFDIVVHVNDETVTVVAGDESSPSTFIKEDGDWKFATCEDFGLDFVASEPEGEAAADDRVTTEETPSFQDLAVEAEADGSNSLPGSFVDLAAIYGAGYGQSDGFDSASHVVEEVDYVADGNSNPPAGGPHWGQGACAEEPAASPPMCGPVPWGIYRTEWEAESLVHNMEHGGVVVWYNTTNIEVVDELEALVTDQINAVGLIVMAPYLDMEDETIALTSWSRIDKFPVEDYRPERVLTFLKAHVRRFNPEGF